MKNYTFFALLMALSLLGFAQQPQLVIPSGHYSFVDRLAISPNGEYVLSGGADGRVKLWNLEGKELQTFRFGYQWVNAMAFTPDSRHILAGGMTGVIKAWNLEGELLFQSRERAYWEVLALSTNNELDEVLAVLNKRIIRLDREANIIGRREFEEETTLEAAFFSPDQDMILGYLENNAYILDTAGQVLHHFPLEDNIVSASWVASEGIVLATMADVFVWEMATDAFQQMPPPDEEENEIVVYTFAQVSPDLKYMAIGVDYYNSEVEYRESAVTLFNMETEELHTISVPQWVYKGIFSKDSQRFLFLNHSMNEDRVFTRLEQYAVGGRKLADYDVGGLAEAFNGLAFLPDRQYLLSAHSDSTLVRWDLRASNPELLRKHQQALLDVQLTSNGSAIMTVEGYSLQIYSSTVKRKIQAINILDTDGQLLHRLSGPAVEQWDKVAFSPDGQSLLTLDTNGLLSLRSLDGDILRSFNYEEKGQLATFQHFAQSPDGQYVVASSGEQDLTVLWTRDGKFAHAFAPPDAVVEGRGVPSCLAFSPNGRSFLVGYYSAPGAFLWGVDGSAIAGIGWGDPGRVAAVGFSADGRHLILARNNGKMGVWNSDGEELFEVQAHEGLIQSIEAVPGTSYLVTISQDESIKFWNLKEERELAQLINLRGNERVISAPDGLFDASPQAMESMYYSLGLETLELEQLKERYYEPNLLPRLLGLMEGGIREVDAMQSLPLFPRVNAWINQDKLFIELEERSGGIGKVTLSVGKNKELLADANPSRLDLLSIELKDFEQFFIPGQDNYLNIRTYNTDGWLRSQAYVLAYRPEDTATKEEGLAFLPGPDKALEEIALYAIIVGTSQYRGSQLNLKYPDRDAAILAEALHKAGTPLFGDRLHIQSLTTDSSQPPRKEEVRKAFVDFAAQAGPEDILLIYLSGHGITYPPNSEQGQFYYLTTDISSDKLDDPVILQNQAIAQDTLLAWLREVRARKQVLILDACQSGQVVDRLEAGQKMLNPDQERALERMKDRSGLFILAGSAANKSAFEASRFGHGLLTYSLVRNMPVVAAQNNQFVDIGQLFAQVREDVPRLAEQIGEIQEPELIGSSSFDIGIINESVSIPKVEAKPVFTRSFFELEEEPFDQLELSKAIGRQLDRYSSGKNPSIVYLNLLSFPHSYRLRGRYEVNEKGVSVRAWLYKGQERATQFSVEGSTGQIDQLAEAITIKAFEWLQQQGKDF